MLQKMNYFGDLTDADAARRLRIELGDEAPPPDVHELRAFKVDVQQRFKAVEEEIIAVEERVSPIKRKRPRWEKLTWMLPRWKEGGEDG